jgi:hypothetical protein
MLTYGFFGFRVGLRRIQRPTGCVLLGRNDVVRRGFPLEFGLGQGREMLVGTRSGIFGVSVTIAGSAQAARRNAGEPCRVMTLWSRLGWCHTAVRGAGAIVRRFR